MRLDNICLKKWENKYCEGYKIQRKSLCIQARPKRICTTDEAVKDLFQKNVTFKTCEGIK